MSIQSYVSADAQQASAACAVKILGLLKDAVARDSRASIAISGGSTPKLLFGEFAKADFDWSNVHVFWVDERGVPPTDSQSNFKLANDNWLAHVKFPASNIHRIQAELPPQNAAQLYADDIYSFFRLAPGGMPHFDIIHRGMGPDMHTASLFPGEPRIDDHENLVAAVYVEKFQQWRITLLPGVLEAARDTLMLVAGDDKAEPLRTITREPYEPKKYPVQIATYHGHNVWWFLDKAAARLLE